MEVARDLHDFLLTGFEEFDAEESTTIHDYEPLVSV